MDPKYKIGQEVYCIVERREVLIINKGRISTIKVHVKFGNILDDLPCFYQVTGCGGTTIPEWDIFLTKEEAESFEKQGAIFPFLHF